MLRVLCTVAATVLSSSVTHAVSLSPNGIGQVLLFPYYFASASDAGFATLINIVNTTPNIKLVRVRFREGKEGAPVGDYNVYLDAHDVWTVALLATADGAGIGTIDKSCAVPRISNDVWALTPLSAASFAGAAAGEARDRLREGYVEVIEMGDYGPAASATAAIPKNVIHISGVAPCMGLANDTGADAGPPTGGLFGSAMLLQVAGGVDYFYPATALTGHSDRKLGYGAITSESPSLADAHPAASVVRDAEGGVIRSTWSNGIDAVSAVLMTDSMQGEFVLEPGTQSRTSFVVSMPTKWHYVHDGLPPRAPFTHAYAAQGACETIDDPLYAGSPYLVTSRVGDHAMPFPEPPELLPSFGALCFASNVLAFNDAAIFDSPHGYRSAEFPDAEETKPYSLNSLFPSGSLSLALFPSLGVHEYDRMDRVHTLVSGPSTVFSPDGVVTSLPSMTYVGLPVVGFAVSSYYNGTLTDEKGQNVLSTYIAGTALRRHLRVE